MRISRRARIRRWMSTMATALGAVFRPKNIRNAFRSVTLGWREYLCFYLALLVMETGFCTAALLADANLQHAREQITENYTYHFEINHLDNEQMSNLNNAFWVALEKQDTLLGKVWYTEEDDGTYTFFVTAPDGVDAGDTLAHVKGDILSQISSGYTVRTSPLYDYDTDYRTPYLASLMGTVLAWLCLSVGGLVVLYLVRLDHFRFTYGIYMTCGADFPMLFAAAAGEMLVIAGLCFLPALLLGGGITATLCLPRGVALSFSVRTALLFPLACLLTALVSVYFPMRRLSKKPPNQLLLARDNSGLVSSPRRSFRLFGEDFPGKYELYTFWRMRKYYARLVVSAVLFAALFVSGLYIADLQVYRADQPAYEYVITYAPVVGAEVETDENGAVLPPQLSAEEAEAIRTDADCFLSDVNAVPGVDYTFWNTAIEGGYSMSHLLITPTQMGGGAGAYTVPSEERASEGYTYALRNYAYTAVDKTYIDMLLDNDLCTVEGDPYAVLTGEKQVILTEDVYNQRTFHFSPGDTVMVAKFDSLMGSLNLVADPQALLRQQIEKCRFTYEEYTVCAVIRGLPAEYNISFGVTYEDFAALTGQEASRDTLYVYLENGTDFETARQAEGGIRKALSYFSGWQVDSTGNYFNSTVRSTRNAPGLTLSLAALLLALSPLVWLFSQIMFYRRRKEELDMLHALGAQSSALAKLHHMAGGVLSGLAFLATVGLSCLCNWGVYLLVTVLLPRMGLLETVHYEYALSLPALLACVAVSVVCGFLSCEIPLYLYRRQGYTGRRDV